MKPVKTKNSIAFFHVTLPFCILFCTFCSPLNAGEIIKRDSGKKTPEELTPLTKEEIQIYRDKFKKLHTLLSEKKLIEFYVLSFDLLRKFIFDGVPDKNKLVISKEERTAFLFLIANAPSVPLEKRGEYIRDENGLCPILLIEYPQKSIVADLLGSSNDDKALSAPEKIIRANAIAGVLKSFKSIVDAGSFEEAPEEETSQERLKRGVRQRDYIAAKGEISFLEATFFSTLVRYFPGDFEKIKSYFKLAGYDENAFETAFSRAALSYSIHRDKETEFLFKKLGDIKTKFYLDMQKGNPKKND